MLTAALLALGCQLDDDGRPGDAWADRDDADGGEYDEDSDGSEPGDGDSPVAAVSCAPTMHHFPIAGPHNIGYDHASCGTGTCAISCPDANANSDWGGAHHGMDLFAEYRSELLAVTDGQVVRVGTPSGTSGLRVRLRDACGWEYYYGHMDEATVVEGQWVTAGQRIGYMGSTGAASVHLHFNVSPNGSYSNDINPLDLLVQTSPTACGGAAPPPPAPPGVDPPAPPPPGCGTMTASETLMANEALTSCDGRFSLVTQSDGNLVLYKQGGGVLWHTYTHGNAVSGLVMQPDGNLVLYSASGSVLWHAGTHGNHGAYLSLQDDGNLVVYSGGTALWHSQTCCH
ncbi:MAG: peptidoglycan DD-metalloendopeptidase family protein [Deltaproteobacteria bacterium]|nr:peptidoglycan DD-metalloendopeptidase family protein [Deltaproteobacteria bacterium]